MDKPGAFIVIVGEVYEKVSKAGYQGGAGTNKLVIGYDNKDLGLIGSVNVKFSNSADLEKAPPKGSMVRAIFKTKPSGQFDTDFPKGDLVSLEVLRAGGHPAPLGTR